MWRCYHVCFRRLYLGHNQQRNKSGRVPTHYEALGVSSKATQAEIKAAYYKLSMLYHPDSGGSSASPEKFQAISNAYEILGNRKSRQIYDKGGFQGDVGSYEAPTSHEYYSRRQAQKTRPPAPSGKTPIYDFDEWSRRHYGETIARRQRAKAQYEQKMGQSSKHESKTMHVALSILIITLVFLGMASTQNGSLDNFDKPQDSKK